MTGSSTHPRMMVEKRLDDRRRRTGDGEEQEASILSGEYQVGSSKKLRESTLCKRDQTTDWSGVCA